MHVNNKTQQVEKKILALATGVHCLEVLQVENHITMVVEHIFKSQGFVRVCMGLKKKVFALFLYNVIACLSLCRSEISKQFLF